MIYITTRNGQQVLTFDHEGCEVDGALEKIRQGIRGLDKHYYSIDRKQLATARAMASHLILMLEDE